MSSESNGTSEISGAVDSINSINDLKHDDQDTKTSGTTDTDPVIVESSNSVNNASLDSNIVKDNGLVDNSPLEAENSELQIKNVEIETSDVPFPPNNCENASSDGGSEYKDAVTPENDSDCHSEISGNSGDESSPTSRRRRSINDEHKASDEESKEDGENEPTGPRESGDGEDTAKDKVLDRDEDKKDPQYIPKRGMFYEHDDRTCEGTPVPVPEETKDKKKKFVADKIDRWGHDMFDSQKQSPKSAQDLIDFYGYDIRNEEEAPKAWRSRRYGRGPNKYTRQWQDEAAYRSKRPPTSKSPTTFKKRDEDFPTVEESKVYPVRGRGRGRFQQQDKGPRERQNFIPKDRRRDTNKSSPIMMNHPPLETKEDINIIPQKTKSSRDDTMKEVLIEKSNIPSKKNAFQNPKIRTEAEAEADIAALSKKFSNAVINIGRDGNILPIGGNNGTGTPQSISDIENKVYKEEPILSSVQVAQHQIHIVPQERPGPHSPPISKEKPVQHENSANTKSKRYSSQRQRSLPQSNHLQQQPQQQQQQPQQQPQQQQPFVHQQQFFAPPPGEPDNSAAMYPGYGPAAPQSAGVFSDSMPGVVFLTTPGYQPTPPPPHMINYSLAPPPPPPQQFSMPLAPPPHPAPEIFAPQPPPGITYYNPQGQPPPPPTRPTTSRKGKFAIPIISPDQVNQPQES